MVSAPPFGGGRTGPWALVPPGTWKMPVPWFLLSLALGRSPMVLSLEKLMGPQDTARCSPGLSCHLWDGDVLCLPGSIVSAPGPVLVPTRLQTELVLRCHQETDCDLCVRVAIHLAVHGHWEEPKDEDKFGIAADPELEEPRNAFLQAQVVLSFQAYPTARCVLLEVQVRAALAQPGQSVGSVVFDCFEAALGAEVRLWSYTQPRYQKELNLTQQLPDCKGLEVRDSIQSCWALPWLSVSADGDDVHLVLDVSEEQHFGLSLYWNQVQGPTKPWWHSNLTGPQNITLNHTDLFPCLCIQVWPLEPDSVRTSLCPFREDPRAHRNLWRAARLRLLPPRGWQLNAPCSLLAEATLCWQAPGGGPCQSLVPPLSRANVTVNKTLQLPLLNAHPNLCVQLWEDDLRALWACPMDKSAPRGRAALLLYSAEDSGFERLVGALASALCQLPLRVAVDLWSRRELSAQGPLAWFHAQRRQTLQDGGVVVLLFSPGAVALCHEWLQDGAAASAPHGPHDAFAASLSCVLPDFLQGRAPGRYVGAYFDGLLHSEAVPALFRSVPVFSLPSQLPDFLGTLQGPAAPRPGRLGERAKQVSRALQPALDQLLQAPGAPGAPGDCTRDGT
ncbi:interleukin-17 receptor C isoform X15 [Neomonachus schauinslandi]|uniref:Interleukin-17 receptor C n=1 Tax=Neomonachus schauinslandi TaxID=29088 RepID=A0A2Y9HME4_NEOSC|nr:interleukin-17 receptor C isoform X15 [Neomonachus schauinslandi]